MLRSRFQGPPDQAKLALLDSELFVISNHSRTRRIPFRAPAAEPNFSHHLSRTFPKKSIHFASSEESAATVAKSKLYVFLTIRFDTKLYRYGPRSAFMSHPGGSTSTTSMSSGSSMQRITKLPSTIMLLPHSHVLRQLRKELHSPIRAWNLPKSASTISIEASWTPGCKRLRSSKARSTRAPSFTSWGRYAWDPLGNGRGRMLRR